MLICLGKGAEQKGDGVLMKGRGFVSAGLCMGPCWSGYLDRNLTCVSGYGKSLKRSANSGVERNRWTPAGSAISVVSSCHPRLTRTGPSSAPQLGPRNGTVGKEAPGSQAEQHGKSQARDRYPVF